MYLSEMSLEALVKSAVVTGLDGLPESITLNEDLTVSAPRVISKYPYSSSNLPSSL